MNDPTTPAIPALACSLVLRVREDDCEVLREGQRRTARFPAHFPTPRSERVQPGNLVATTTAADGTATVSWRWYDAVVLDETPEGIRLWEPGHGEVLAQPRPTYVSGRPGARAYLSAGLPGADWWVAGPARPEAGDADVELDEVSRLCTDHGLWDSLGRGRPRHRSRGSMGP